MEAARDMCKEYDLTDPKQVREAERRCLKELHVKKLDF